MIVLHFTYHHRRGNDDNENGDKDDGISSPKTTKTKTNVHTRD